MSEVEDKRLDELKRRGEKFRVLAHKLFNTPDGREVLSAMVDSYVLGLKVTADANTTYFELGKADVVKGLKLIADSDPKEMKVSYDYNREEG